MMLLQFVIRRSSPGTAQAYTPATILPPTPSTGELFSHKVRTAVIGLGAALRWNPRTKLMEGSSGQDDGDIDHK